MGQKLAAMLALQGANATLRLLNLKDRFVPQGTVEQLSAQCRIDADALMQTAEELLYEQ